jgi:hypothetical protein
MWAAFCLAGIVLAVVTRHRKLKLRRELVRTPLAGYDTGVRSPWRTPGRFGKPHRGF